jgi:hypothetical protein
VTAIEIAVTAFGVAAIIGELWYFLAPQKASDKRTVRPSDAPIHAEPADRPAVRLTDDV